MHFLDYTFIFGLALVLFGPKRLPEIGRQIGKLMLEFRKASNEFKMQIEDELRAAEDQDRQKQISAIQASPAVATEWPGTAPVKSLPFSEAQSGLVLQPPSTGETVSTAMALPLPETVALEPDPSTQVLSVPATEAALAEDQMRDPYGHAAEFYPQHIADMQAQTRHLNSPPDIPAVSEEQKGEAPLHHG